MFLPVNQRWLEIVLQEHFFGWSRHLFCWMVQLDNIASKYDFDTEFVRKWWILFSWMIWQEVQNFAKKVDLFSLFYATSLF